MRLKNWIASSMLSAGVLSLAALVVSAQVPQVVPDRAEGHTFPSAVRELSLKIPDIVREVTVKPGDRVTRGQLLMQEEDAEEQLRYTALKMAADSKAAVTAAEVTLKSREVELKRIRQLYDDKVAAELELERATLEVEVARAEVDRAKLEHDQSIIQAKIQNEILNQMRIVSPIDGIVEMIDVEKGEVVDPQKLVLTVVNIDTLHVEAPVDTRKSLGLKVGQELGVLYEGSTRPMPAKIIFMSPRADRRSNTQLVRLEMPNPEGRPAGLKVQLVLPAAEK